MLDYSLLDIWNILKRRWIAILFMMILVGVTSFTVSTFLIPARYSSNVKLLVNIPTENIEQQLNNAQLQANTRLIATYSDIIKDDSILNSAKQKANLSMDNDKIRKMIAVTANRDSQVFTLTVTSVNAQQAADLANAITAAFKEKVSNIYSDTQTFVVLSQAEVTNKRVSPNIRNNTLLGMLAGLLLSLLVFIARDLLDTAVKDETIITELGWSFLGSVSKMSDNELNETRWKRKER